MNEIIGQTSSPESVPSLIFDVQTEEEWQSAASMISRSKNDDVDAEVSNETIAISCVLSPRCDSSDLHCIHDYSVGLSPA